MTEFPSDHAGFFGDEHGQQGEPEAFAEVADCARVLASTR